MKMLMAAAMLFVISCNSSDKKKENVNIQGAYKMLFQSVNDGKKDTTYTSLQQMKIYTDKYMLNRTLLRREIEQQHSFRNLRL
ncbi:MAG: hypothetical protein ABIO55_04425 [Ginsengibacter sp.]